MTDDKTPTPPKPPKAKAKSKSKSKRPKPRKIYSPDFKRMVVNEVAMGRTQAEVAAQYHLSHGQVSTWCSTIRAQAAPPELEPELEPRERTPLLLPARTDGDELDRLRAEVERLRADRERLRRAVAVLLE